MVKMTIYAPNQHSLIIGFHESMKNTRSFKKEERKTNLFISLMTLLHFVPIQPLDSRIRTKNGKSIPHTDIYII